MSGLMDKAKDAMGKGSSGGSSGASSGGSSGGSSGMNSGVHKGIDMATDKAGMGDKYDSKINDQADKQMENYGKK
ncbi:hypothetical protein LTR37_020375 [Vermiconidia calcicola]|uniref:Uncharacterized protein n=1 Tax=Vermiconidia calcicola TaxID=1690605 RepID=A0ACC3MBH3_9PEZI|nr:hypothetical protein LTR37_020375 [Vermiconidia calcicola]